MTTLSAINDYLKRQLQEAKEIKAEWEERMPLLPQRGSYEYEEAMVAIVWADIRIAFLGLFVRGD